MFQRLFAARGDRPNVRLVDAKLTRRDAQRIVDEIPGTYIHKVYATKG